MKVNKILLTGLVLTTVAGTAMASENNQNFNVGHYRSTTEANNSVLYGEDINVTQHNDGKVVKNILIGGYNNMAQHDAHNSATFGTSNNNNSANSIVTGFHNTITNAENTIAGGVQNASHSSNTLVFGNTNAIDFRSDNSFAGGERNKITGKNSLVFGEDAVVEGDNTYAIGKEAIATASNSIAIGNQTNVSEENSLAIGHNITTGKKGSIGIGTDITNTNGYGIVIGNNSSTNSLGGVVVGDHSKSTFDNGVAIGNSNEAGNNSTAVGSIANATGVSSVAIGHMVSAEGTYAVNIGTSNEGASKYSTMVGSNNYVVHSDHLEDPQGDTVMGNANIAQDSYHVTVVGTDNEISNANYAVAIGNNTSVTKEESVAIGHSSNANTVVGTASAVIDNNTHEFAGSAPVGTVSIGDAGKERTITNLAAGRVSETSTDAVNGSQLHSVIEETNKLGTKAVDLDNKIDTKVNDLNNKIIEVGSNTLNQANNYTDSQVSSVGAQSAALAGLHPLEFNKDDKASYAASVGHYRNANAVAVGAFYRPNERTMISGAVSFGKHLQMNVGVAFKTGKGSEYINEAKSKDSRIEKLEALVEKLTAEVAELKANK